MGAALVEMVCNLTLGRKRFAAVEVQMGQTREAAARIGARARELVDEDIHAYARVSDAMALPRDNAEAAAARTEAIQSALKGAAIPPLETMRCAAEVVVLARSIVPLGNPSAVSDAATAAMSALAGFEAARLNVEINMASVRDEAWVAEMAAQLTAFESPYIGAGHAVSGAESIIRDRR
jgi:formiminotetrahydrofolate cyclodeaminase